MLAICDDPGKRAEKNSFEIPPNKQHISIHPRETVTVCVQKDLPGHYEGAEGAN